MAEGFVRSSSGLGLARDQALVELAKAAREELLEVASVYRQTISYRQLAADIQARAGIKAGTSGGWLASVVAMVCRVCHRLGEPALTSLAVDERTGRVGAAFDEVRRVAGLPLPADSTAREQAAAIARLECYRRYAPGVPEDAQPTLVSSAAAARRAEVKAPRTRSTRAAAAPVKPKAPVIDVSRPKRGVEIDRAVHVLCSSCFLQTPPGPECQNCGAPLR